MSMYTEITRLIIASIVGFIMGIERTKRRKAAGVGTFSIICITSCFLTILSAYGFTNNADPSRLVANIITAIGFVAGGVIFTVNSNEKVKINGLTTGAEIFCVSSLGIGIGLGLYIIVLTVVILVEINIALAMRIKKHYSEKVNIFKDSVDEDYKNVISEDDI